MDYVKQLEERVDNLQHELSKVSQLLYLERLEKRTMSFNDYFIVVNTKDNEQLIWCRHLDRNIFFISLEDMLTKFSTDVFVNFSRINIYCKRHSKNNIEPDKNWNTTSIWELCCIKEDGEWVISNMNTPQLPYNYREDLYQDKSLKEVVSKITNRYKIK